MTKIEDIWGPVRSLLRESCTSYRLMQIVSRSGVDITRLTGLPLGASTAEKNALISGVDEIYDELDASGRQRFLTVVTEELLQEKPELAGTLETYLQRVGWKVHDGQVLPVDVFDITELPLLPETAHADLVKAATRVRDGDLTGAITAACGAVDSATFEAYAKYGLGDAAADSFQQRVVKSLDASGALNSLEAELLKLRWDQKDAQKVAKNVRGALNQGAYVLQKLRSDMGDVHGSHPTIEAVVYDAVKWAALSVRLLRNVWVA